MTRLDFVGCKYSPERSLGQRLLVSLDKIVVTYL